MHFHYKWNNRVEILNQNMHLFHSPDAFSNLFCIPGVCGKDENFALDKTESMEHILEEW